MPIGACNRGCYGRKMKNLNYFLSDSRLQVCAPKPTEVPNCPVPAFCNTFDKSTKQYCRRYHALCPEHDLATKFKVGKATATCGYPLPRSAGDGDVCRKKKGTCTRSLLLFHHFWGPFLTHFSPLYLCLCLWHHAARVACST